MKKMRDMTGEKMIQEAPEGTPLDSVAVNIDVEFRILSEKAWEERKVYSWWCCFSTYRGL